MGFDQDVVPKSLYLHGVCMRHGTPHYCTEAADLTDLERPLIDFPSLTRRLRKSMYALSTLLPVERQFSLIRNTLSHVLLFTSLKRPRHVSASDLITSRFHDKALPTTLLHASVAMRPLAHMTCAAYMS